MCICKTDQEEARRIFALYFKTEFQKRRARPSEFSFPFSKGRMGTFSHVQNTQKNMKGGLEGSFLQSSFANRSPPAGRTPLPKLASKSPQIHPRLHFNSPNALDMTQVLCVSESWLCLEKTKVEENRKRWRRDEEWGTGSARGVATGATIESV